MIGKAGPANDDRPAPACQKAALFAFLRTHDFQAQSLGGFGHLVTVIAVDQGEVMADVLLAVVEVLG